ncbi:MAG: glycosyltransferase family 4 protein [Verrucomicrobia bacterium]|nr:glycosyltransferase family 4 protein [Verrucomicrobiota bacterium]
MFHLAYVFERFPTFTQTFCVREILELERIGVKPVIFSIHDTRAEDIRHFPAELAGRVQFLPPEEKLYEEVRRLIDEKKLPQSVVLTLRYWGERPDKPRVYEAAWIGHKLRELNARVWHAHTHFAGIGARTCWWLRKFYGLSFSFTAHANDVFCQVESQKPGLPELFRDASLVVTVSDYTAKRLRLQYAEAAPRIRRVYNGLDFAPFVEARSKADRSRAAGGILSVGRLIEKKGYDDLISACALLRDRGIKFNCRIVGEGPLETELKSQITKLNLQDAVQLTGPLPMNEIIRLLTEETQVFVLACKTEHDGGKDNLPTVLMEAMAASLPCVSTRLAGVPEMVIDGVTGLLCNERHPEQLAGEIGALLQDPERCDAMGAAGLGHAKTHFAKEVTARELLRAFAAHSAMRFDVSLALREKLISEFLLRMFKSTSQLRHQVVKARDKTFDLDRFMSGA